MDDAVETRTLSPSISPNLSYKDAYAAIRWLTEVLDFRVTAMFERDGIVAHAQLAWEDGAINLSSRNDPVPSGTGRMHGTVACYLMARSRERVDELYERARRSGADVRVPLQDVFTGNHQFSVADPEGNVWSVGIDWLQTDVGKSMKERTV
jgi:uncharacterized glyoxalase superfamily protein PhnB